MADRRDREQGGARALDGFCRGLRYGGHDRGLQWLRGSRAGVARGAGSVTARGSSWGSQGVGTVRMAALILPLRCCCVEIIMQRADSRRGRSRTIGCKILFQLLIV